MPPQVGPTSGDLLAHIAIQDMQSSFSMLSHRIIAEWAINGGRAYPQILRTSSKHDLLDGAEAYHKEVSSGNEAVMVPVLARGLEERFAVKNHG